MPFFLLFIINISLVFEKVLKEKQMIVSQIYQCLLNNNSKFIVILINEVNINKSCFKKSLE